MKTEIYIATHKPIEVKLPACYKRLQVNSAKNGEWEGYYHDGYGVNISNKNESYCELTALYSLWKNSDADYKGLVHYRRFIGRKPSGETSNYTCALIPATELNKYCIDEVQIARELCDYDLILTEQLCPYPINAYEDLQRFCYLKDIQTMMEVVAETVPEYLPSLKQVLSAEHLSYCNMFIGTNVFTDAYCSWLFPLLEAVEARTDISTYDVQHKRIYGYLAEVLLNVYVVHNRCRVVYHNMVQPLASKNSIKRIARKGEYALNISLGRLGVFSFRQGQNRSVWKSRYEALKGHSEIETAASLQLMMKEMHRVGAFRVVDITTECGFEAMQAAFYREAYPIEVVSAVGRTAEECEEILQYFSQFFEHRISKDGRQLILRIVADCEPNEATLAECSAHGIRVIRTKSSRS